MHTDPPSFYSLLGLFLLFYEFARGEKGYIIKAPKSEAGIRDIAIGDEVLDELRQARAQYMMDAFTYGTGFQNLGFVVRQADGSPYKPDSMTQKWERFLEESGLPKIRLHDLLHSTHPGRGQSPRRTAETGTFGCEHHAEHPYACSPRDGRGSG